MQYAKHWERGVKNWLYSQLLFHSSICCNQDWLRLVRPDLKRQFVKEPRGKLQICCSLRHRFASMHTWIYPSSLPDCGRWCPNPSRTIPESFACDLRTHDILHLSRCRRPWIDQLWARRLSSLWWSGLWGIGKVKQVSIVPWPSGYFGAHSLVRKQDCKASKARAKMIPMHLRF